MKSVTITIPYKPGDPDLGLMAHLDSFHDVTKQPSARIEIAERLSELMQSSVTRQMVNKWFAQSGSYRILPSTRLFVGLLVVLEQLKKEKRKRK